MAARCSSVAFTKAQRNNKFIGSLTTHNGTTWLLQFDGWKPTGANIYKPINELPCPPPLVWASRYTALSNKEVHDHAVAEAQLDGRKQQSIESTKFIVDMELGKFEDNKYFIWLHFTDADFEKLNITPRFVDHGTKFEACPKHITLGVAHGVDEAQLQEMVGGTFEISLKKWSKHLSSSTYLLDDEFNALLNEVAARFSFHRRRSWHVSL